MCEATIPSNFGYHNLVQFHFWWKETMLKDEKGLKYFVSNYNAAC